VDGVPRRGRRRRPARLRLREARQPLPSAGGLFASLEAGFGRGALVGISAWLGYIAAIVIVTAMIAVSFAAAVVLDRLTRRGSHAAGHASLGPV
jgi:hypothetical protein